MPRVIAPLVVTLCLGSTALAKGASELLQLDLDVVNAMPSGGHAGYSGASPLDSTVGVLASALIRLNKVVAIGVQAGVHDHTGHDFEPHYFYNFNQGTFSALGIVRITPRSTKTRMSIFFEGGLGISANSDGYDFSLSYQDINEFKHGSERTRDPIISLGLGLGMPVSHSTSVQITGRYQDILRDTCRLGPDCPYGAPQFLLFGVGLHWGSR